MKRAGLILLQLLVTAGGIFYVFHDQHRRDEISNAIRHADWRWLVIGWLCYGLVETLATVRWQILLRVQGIALGWLRCGVLVIIGLFFNMFLPGLIGGDAMRLYFMFKQQPEKKTGITLSVAMDRLLGLFSIITIAAVVVFFRFQWLQRFPQTAHITYVALGLLAGILSFVVALFLVVSFGALDRLPKRLPLRHLILESGQALGLYRQKIGRTVIAYFLTIGSHLAYYLSFYCASRALITPLTRGASVPDMLSIMPLVNTITSLPISVGGVGVRETLFQQMLGRLADVPAGAAALTASLGFAIQASWGLVGGGAYLFLREGKRR